MWQYSTVLVVSVVYWRFLSGVICRVIWVNLFLGKPSKELAKRHSTLDEISLKGIVCVSFVLCIAFLASRVFWLFFSFQILQGFQCVLWLANPASLFSITVWWKGWGQLFSMPSWRVGKRVTNYSVCIRIYKCRIISVERLFWKKYEL